MPELSRFFGIIIRMFPEPSERHHTPHFHAYYQEHVAVFSISPVGLMAGSIPQRQQRLVEAWAELHQEELLAGWNLLDLGRQPRPIAPLRWITSMSHPIFRVLSFAQTGPYTLQLRFDDGLSRAIDFEPILAGELFGPLRDPKVFAQVKLDSEIHTLVWPSGADFDPATLHDWPDHESDFRAAAERWNHVSA